ncbi:MAG: DUF4352 domain-containing protein [Candidatus Dormibacteria bacterium]
MKRLLFGAIALIALAACGESTNAGTAVTSPAAGATAAAQPTSAPTFKVGDQIKVGGSLLYSVTSAKVVQPGEFDPAPTGEYLAVAVAFTNQGASPVDVSSMVSFSLRDANGQTYNETIITGQPNAPDGEIAAGDKLAGTLIYDAPKGGDLKLYFKNDIFSGGAVVVDLGTF